MRQRSRMLILLGFVTVSLVQMSTQSPVDTGSYQQLTANKWRGVCIIRNQVPYSPKLWSSRQQDLNICRKYPENSEIKSMKNLLNKCNLENIKVPVFGFDTIDVYTDNIGNRVKLGSGNAGTIYLGHFKTWNMTVAVKLAHPWLSVDDFRREIHMLVMLNDSGVTPLIFGVAAHVRDDAKCHVAIMMECLVDDVNKMFADANERKPSVYHLLKRPEKKTTKFWLEIARNTSIALTSLHNSDVFHGDLRADNIILYKRAQSTGLYLVDLGQASFVKETYNYHVEESVRDEWKTKYPYIAPELIDGESFSKKADVFSLGYFFKQIHHAKGVTCLGDLYKWCMSKDPGHRPTLDTVVEQLIFLLEKLS